MNKKRTFFIALAIILTAGIYYFYSRRNKDKADNVDRFDASGGKLYTYSWIGCNSYPSENISGSSVQQSKSGLAGIQIGGNFVAQGNVSVGDRVQILTNRGSDVEGEYEVVGIGAGCMRGTNGFPNLIVIDLSWNCGSHPSPSSSDGGLMRIIKS